MKNPRVDLYFAEGCGRCPLGGTPDCKVRNWQEEMKLLRDIILECGLTEEIKWSVPCYVYQNHNILILSAFREYCAISFFKGSLLKDEKGLLDKQGKNSQATRLIKITNAQQVQEKRADIKTYILAAIEIEQAGLQVKFKKLSEYEIPEELQHKLESDPVFKSAFESLTPGRQKGYMLHFSKPTQSKTRVSRIEKCTPMIMEGKGWNGR